ncbi:MAG: hypothetical protein K2N06_11425 [Oscillospiraceae bacterium]|nr:hypothetical protein [Oscillospiraceae bacterium]
MKVIIFIAAVLAALMIMFAHSVECSASATSTSLPEKYLEGNELELYREVLKNIIAIANGRQNAEPFYISVSRPFASTREYEEAIEKVMFFIHNYAPEYLYWSDSKGYLVYDTVRCGIVYGISPAFQERGNQYKITAKILNNAKSSLSNAKEIAEKYQEKSDYEKVWGYAEEICALTDYSSMAAKDDGKYAKENIGPWNIVYVFDRDHATNVVCGGFARAFQYLCSLGGVECHYVTGYVSDEYHAWNIVVIDGENYFVDLTVCSQYSDSDISRHHPFVMNSIKSSDVNCFIAFYSQSGMTHSHLYTYHENELKYLPESLRILTTKEYSKESPADVIAVAVSLAAGVAFILVRTKKI